jgi:hypothetical protein
MNGRTMGESETGERGTGLPISTGYDYQMCSVPLCLLPLKCKYQGIPFCQKHFARQYQRDHRPAPKDPRYFLGARGEAAVRTIFLQYGRDVQDQESKCKYDFLVDGWRVEVKTVSPSGKKPGWVATIQRNGILDEQTDFYVIRLENQYEPFHILFAAPVGKKTLYISRGPTLWQRKHDFDAFAKGNLVCRKPRPALPSVQMNLFPAAIGGQLLPFEGRGEQR